MLIMMFMLMMLLMMELEQGLLFALRRRRRSLSVLLTNGWIIRRVQCRGQACRLHAECHKSQCRLHPGEVFFYHCPDLPLKRHTAPVPTMPHVSAFSLLAALRILVATQAVRPHTLLRPPVSHHYLSTPGSSTMSLLRPPVGGPVVPWDTTHHLPRLCGVVREHP